MSPITILELRCRYNLLLGILIAPHIEWLCSENLSQISKGSSLLFLLTSDLALNLTKQHFLNSAFSHLHKWIPTMKAAAISQNVEKQAPNMIKGNRSNESYAGNMFTKVIIFSSKCLKNKNSQSQPRCVSTERSASQNENQETSQVLFETYSIFYNVSLSHSSGGFKSQITKEIGKSAQNAGFGKC